MKVRVDSSLCQGHAMCHALAPEVYTLDDLGFCNIGEKEVHPTQQAAALRGRDGCPERAITILDHSEQVSDTPTLDHRSSAKGPPYS
jgi:ferredoxin